MISIVRGKQWPLGLPEQEGMYAIIDNSSLTFLCLMDGITSQESNAFRRGGVEFGQTVKDNIPFIVWKFHGFDFDCYINAFKEPQEKRDAFLAGPPEANLLQLYLVERRSGITEGIRAIGAELGFMTAIKAAFFNQLTAYTNAHGVDMAAAAILNQNTTADLGRAAGLKF